MATRLPLWSGGIHDRFLGDKERKRIRPAPCVPKSPSSQERNTKRQEANRCIMGCLGVRTLSSNLRTKKSATNSSRITFAYALQCSFARFGSSQIGIGRKPNLDTEWGSRKASSRG